MTAIAVFVKTPGLSPVKTRLALSVGTARAERIYELCAYAVIELAERSAIGPVYWATAEDAAAARRRWSSRPLLEQGGGELGERMHRVLAELVERHGSGMLLGADAPQIEPAVLRRAAGWLKDEAAASVLGPAADGGFWTFGANHVPPLDRWERVAYSRPDTLKAFRESIGDDPAWLELPMLTDIDTEADIERVLKELSATPRPSPRQFELMELLNEAKPA
ncbi:MAG: DUF2064 domain-containing protein [Gammaproteobacteria bacterium]|jgi:rSAM/selenodomain-associated transferase 1|nr:DUF2064 domain-containing protein [Gammaproteobacteria bacterium]